MKKLVPFICTLVIETGCTLFAADRLPIRFTALMSLAGLLFPTLVLVISESSRFVVNDGSSTASLSSGSARRFKRIKPRLNSAIVASLLYAFIGLFFYMIGV
ncbi:MAG TPA: hypothetical protein VFK44_05785 [Bacillales bacterium]|nr:hypothetical protein [Bacillales bacterium]